MRKNTLKLEEIAKVDPFTVPEAYFEGLTSDIMSRLPEHVREETKTVNLWTRVQPWLYMAAMFIGIALMVNLFVGNPTHSIVKTYAAEGLNLSSSTDIEDFYHYFEDELAKIVYNDAMADLSNETTDNN
jgi:glutamine phosphoribosylpyrophosphate amidotransferase